MDDKITDDPNAEIFWVGDVYPAEPVPSSPEPEPRRWLRAVLDLP